LWDSYKIGTYIGTKIEIDRERERERDGWIHDQAR